MTLPSDSTARKTDQERKSADFLNSLDGQFSGLDARVNNLEASEPGGTSDYINIADQKTSGTNGGGFTSGAWRTRDANIVVSDSGGHASIASNQILLAEGVYRFRCSAVAYEVDNHQLRLRDITGAATVGTGINEDVGIATDVGSRAVVSGEFTIAATTTFEVQHRCSTTRGTSGYGRMTGWGTEVYMVAEFWKVG